MGVPRYLIKMYTISSNWSSKVPWVIVRPRASPGRRFWGRLGVIRLVRVNPRFNDVPIDGLEPNIVLIGNHVRVLCSQHGKVLFGGSLPQSDKGVDTALQRQCCSLSPPTFPSTV